MTASQLHEAQLAIADAASDILLGRKGELRGDTLPNVLGIAAFTAGMGPLLGYWIEQGRLTAPRTTATLLGEHLDHGRRRQRILTKAMHTVIEGFADRGIPAVVLKGMSTAFTTFPDAATRPVADIDLLVAPRDWDGASAVLRAQGFEPDQPQGLPFRLGWRHRDAPTAIPSLEMNHAASPWSLDLHRALNRRFCGGIVAGLGSPDPVHLVSVPRDANEIRDLAEPWNLAFLAFHGSAHFEELQLVRLVELVLVMRRDFQTTSSWTPFVDLIERTHTAPFLFPAMELAERWIPGVLDASVRRRLQSAASKRMRHVVRRTRPATAWQQHRKSLDTRLMWSPTIRGAIRCLWEHVWPSSASGSSRWPEVVTLQLRRLRGIVRGRISLRR